MPFLHVYLIQIHIIATVKHHWYQWQIYGRGPDFKSPPPPPCPCPHTLQWSTEGFLAFRTLIPINLKSNIFCNIVNIDILQYKLF